MGAFLEPKAARLPRHAALCGHNGLFFYERKTPVTARRRPEWESMGRGLYEGPPEIKTPGAWCDADDLRPSDFKKLAVAKGAGGFLASDAGQQFASCQALAKHWPNHWPNHLIAAIPPERSVDGTPGRLPPYKAGEVSQNVTDLSKDYDARQEPLDIKVGNE